MAGRGVSPLPRVARPYQGRRAGLVSRLVASAVDAAVVGLLVGAGYAGVTAIRFILSPRGFTFPDTSLLLSMAAGFGVCVAYLTVCWWSSGRTYGDLLMGLRVVNLHGQRMHLAGSLVRALLCTCFPIGLFWVALSRENRSAQDLVLRTSVIYDWQSRDDQRLRRTRG
ncbi:RDD family protein [Phycicoccus sp. M110.8]|uniref:RDD family protein n=1 Tax=Phycicoccus sp. M110.8 TaxID=3075433 RepID=UPI0028FD26D9|nr:RDD family protein [Phycicoccus sp. M110.8]MDU0314159.1 RDD family protein [Phycicoccus sp. M110.8]